MSNQERLDELAVRIREAYSDYVVGSPDPEVAVDEVIRFLSREARHVGTDEDVRDALIGRALFPGPGK